MSFSVQCQYLTEKYDLLEQLAQIAVGYGKYCKVAVSDRLRASEILLDRGHGRPKQSLEIEPPVQYIKRVVGVNDADV